MCSVLLATVAMAAVVKISFGDMSRCKGDILIDACCSCARMEYFSGCVKTMAKFLSAMSW